MSSPPTNRLNGMATKEIARFRSLEGRKVGLALRCGDRIDGCELVSIGSGRRRTVWVFTDGRDEFVPFEDVLDVWEAA